MTIMREVCVIPAPPPGVNKGTHGDGPKLNKGNGK